MPGLPASLTRTIRRALAPLLSNTYSRSVVEAGVEDAHFNETAVPGTPVSGLPCVFLWADRLVIDEGGRSTVKTPTLYVRYDDLLAVGDLVSDVVDRDGTVIMSGPAVVDTIDPAAESGGSAVKIAVLKFVAVERSV